jgi:hypothetical protein
MSGKMLLEEAGNHTHDSPDNYLNKDPGICPETIKYLPIRYKSLFKLDKGNCGPQP